jgi:hypothetical protein
MNSEPEKPALHKDNKQNGIAAKLAWITGQMERIPKHGRNEQQGYAFAREADIVDYVRPYLALQNLALMWDTEQCTLFETKTAAGRPSMRCELTVHLAAWDGDTPSAQPVSLGRFPGLAIDSGDKAVTKALTSAKKYAYMLTFHLSTGEDLEDDRAEDRSKPKPAAAAAGTADTTKVTRLPRPRSSATNENKQVDPERERVKRKIFALIGEYAIVAPEAGMALAEEFNDPKRRHDHDLLDRMYGKRSLHELTSEQLSDFVGKLERRIAEASVGLVTP